jgi:signal transduction histidine kinase
MDTPAWWTQQIAEFVASVSPCTTETEAARAVVERAAEVLDADVAALMADGELLAAVGYAEGTEPVGDLKRIQPGVPDSQLEVPGVGWCQAAAAALTYPPGATLVLGRRDGLTRQEAALLGGMARVAAMTMAMLRLLDHERAARAEVERLAREQAALRRAATLVARGALPDQVFAVVAEEVGNVLAAADFTMVARYDAGRSVEVVGGWSRAGRPVLVGRRSSLGGRNVSTLVFEHNGPARVDDHLIEGAEPLTTAARAVGMRSSVGAPISVDGRLWGVMIVASVREHALPPGTEYQLAQFTELIGTTIANTQARQEVSALADEQAALRRVATLVARGDPPRAVFAAVAQEAGRLLPADLTLIGRYEEGTVTGVAGWSATGEPVPIRSRVSLGGRNVTEMVRRTARPARLDSYADASGDAADDARGRGISSSVGAPISVEGRLWGIMIAAAVHGQHLPPNTERRLADFTDLVATAIANAEANAELKASRARIVATADQTRRRIERDLHDGVQQRLVTLALEIRAAQAKVPHQPELMADLDHVAAGLSSTLDELREFARGIHPAILAKGGLASALNTLVRRSSIRVTLDMRLRERLPEHLEVTAYYVISEALTNAAKHAKASAVHVRVDTADGVLRLHVGDDGVGGADPARGTGLVGLRDRVEATGGTLTLRSRYGEGTHLLIELPARPRPT